MGFLLGYFLLPMRRKHSSGPPNLWITLMMLAPMMFDAGTQWIGLRTSTNEVRLFTGLLFGIGLAPLLVYVLSLIPASRRVPVLKNSLPETTELDSKDPWLSNRSLLLGLPIALALYLVIDSLSGSTNTIFYWSLSPLIIGSAVWHIFFLPVFLVILIAWDSKIKARISRMPPTVPALESGVSGLAHRHQKALISSQKTRTEHAEKLVTTKPPPAVPKRNYHWIRHPTDRRHHDPNSRRLLLGSDTWNSRWRIRNR